MIFIMRFGLIRLNFIELLLVNIFHLKHPDNNRRQQQQKKHPDLAPKNNHHKLLHHIHQFAESQTIRLREKPLQPE